MKLTRIEVLMKKCERPLDYKAYRLSLTCSLDKEELIEIGRLEAIKAFHTFEKGHGMTQRNWMLTIAEQRMCKHIRVQMRRYYEMTYFCGKDQELPEIGTYNMDLEAKHFTEAIQELTPSSREIILTIFRMPLELVKVIAMNKPKKTRGRLRHMLKSQGWTDRAISSCFREIKVFLMR